MEELYATVVTRLLAHGKKEDEVVKNLVAHLKEKGRVKLLPGILRSLVTLQERNRTLGATVEVAHEKDAKHALAEAKALGIEADKAVVNPILLSGWRARKEGMLVDRSGKRALSDLYHGIVKA